MRSTPRIATALAVIALAAPAAAAAKPVRLEDPQAPTAARADATSLNGSPDWAEVGLAVGAVGAVGAFIVVGSRVATPRRRDGAARPRPAGLD
jgi:hypothetical protein